ncbi:MAG: glycoside hydrolase family 88 protein, partial [Kiritimatiellae bacterium]|nr:glycoside hydrolase family 88 protein [Kiritimatiellia bacterium]
MRRLIGWMMVCWAVTASAVSDAWEQETVMANAVKTAEWMLQHPMKHNQLDWTYGAFYQGVTALGLADPTLPFLGIVREHGKKNGWGHLARTYHADDHCIGQSWLELAFFDNNPTYWARIRQNYDYVMANPHTGPMVFTARDNQKRWSWCDALFMSPTVLVRLGGVTGDRRYWTFMDQEYRATYDLLYHPESHLFFRDTRYVEKRTKNGKRVFWSRGEGWVFGGLAVILRDLPADWPTRPYYETLYREMAEALRAAQREDGAWGPSILDSADPDMPEMSGTAFFTYGMLWGINNGLLDRGTYLPVVQRSWRAICRNINDEGRLGWVQQIGDRPVSDYGADSTEVYAVGAFLDAAMELRKLIAADAHPQRVTVTVENPVCIFRPSETVELAWPVKGLTAENLRVFDCRNSRVLPHQLGDEDQDGQPDRLLFALPMMARQKREIWLFNGTDLPAAPADAVCVSRDAPDRLDDYAWENDRIACRVYGPVIMLPPPKGEGLVSSG